MRVSFEKFLTLPSSYLTEDYDGDEESEEDEGIKITIIFSKLYIFFFSVVPVSRGSAPSRGRRRSKGVPMGTQTKHDTDVCGRKNVRNMEKVILGEY